MNTVRLTMAQALVRFLVAQRTVVDGRDAPLFPGVFAIFGHGNVTCMGEALEAVQDDLPTWRGQNEQSMGLAAVGYAKAARRRQVMVCCSSIGPGALNMVTAAGVAHANRLPVLFLAGDTFANRFPDPVLQQLEHFGDPTLTANDAFRAVSRYWDRITRPEQLMGSLPQAVATMLDPADCGPAFLALPQDVQGEAFDYPAHFFQPRTHRIRRAGVDEDDLDAAAALLTSAKAPLIVAGGGVHYSGAVETLTDFAERHGVPVAETVAGRGVLTHDHPNAVGALGVIGSASANAAAAKADVVLAIGTRLQDFTTGSWSVFENPDMRLITLNTARFDAAKHGALSLVGDAKRGLTALDARLLDTRMGHWVAPGGWLQQTQRDYTSWKEIVDARTAPVGPASANSAPTYAQVIGAVNRRCGADDLILTAAGGLPGELMKTWKIKAPGTFDCEFGFSCMGYEIAGGWGARMARPDHEVTVMVGDGSYLMLNADIYSTVLTGNKLIVVVCDNGGYAVIDRLQVSKGGASFNNMLKDCRSVTDARVDFAAHARSLGAIAEKVSDIPGFEAAYDRARAADRTYVIVIDTSPHDWTPGDAWWDVGMPEVSNRPAVGAALTDLEKGRTHQRRGE